MSHRIEQSSPCRVVLTATLPAERVGAEREKVVAEWMRGVRVDGFRKGKSPRHLVERRYAKEIEDDLAERLVHIVWDEVRAEDTLRPAGPLEVRDSGVKPDGSFELAAELDVFPKVELPSLDGFKAPEVEIEPKPDEVETYLGGLRERQAQWEPADDEAVDAVNNEVDHRTAEILALQQPVASDLRFLISIIRVAHEIERSGDLVVNCAKGILRQQGFHLGSQMQGVLARLCRAALELFARGIDSLADMDPEAGQRLDHEDDVVDTLVGEFYTLLATEAEGMQVDTAIELSRVGRYMERIADHAVNIGEHIGFAVTGIFPRHGNIDEH